MTLSRAAIDRIGDRLRIDGRDPSAQAELLLYCEQVRLATAQVKNVVVNSTTSSVTSRDGKSFRSIVDKLKRQSVRLSQIQDIEGCRCVVDTIVEQDALVHRLVPQFEKIKVDDLRVDPSHGYRAAHLIATIGTERYEIQIRSRLQHLWAQAVELIADRYDDVTFKYGGGNLGFQVLMQAFSSDIWGIELSERALFIYSSISDVEDYETDENALSLIDFHRFDSIKFKIKNDLEKIPFPNEYEASLGSGNKLLLNIWDDEHLSSREATKTVNSLRVTLAGALLDLIGKLVDGA